ncbi:MAG: sensor histidine kinase [Eubacteriales bacterium]|nr:sensor histidine kinase [Eubacteriales bacterium]
MKRPFYKTIRGRLVLIVMALILALGIGISSASYLIFHRNLQKTLIQSTETNLQLLSENIDGHLDNIAEFLSWCQYNDQISKFLMTEKDSENYASVTSLATDVLNTSYLSNPSKNYIHRLVIAGLTRQDYLQLVSANYSVDKPLPQMIRELPFFEEYLEIKSMDSYTFQVIEEPFTNRKAEVIPIIRPIQNPYGVGNIGFLYLSVSMDLFLEELNAYTHEEGNELLFTIGDTFYMIEEGKAVPLEEPLTFSEFSEHYQVRSSTEVYSLPAKGAETIAVVRPLSFQGCSVIQTISRETFSQQFHQYFLLIALIFLAIMVIGLGLIAVLTNAFTKPVEKLRKRISLIAGGDFTQDSEILWNNELGDMGNDINQLARDIQDLIEKRVEDENQKRDYEYRLLQSQINPHFLYNTLNSIKWMATIQNAPGIAEMTLALSRLLKNISKGTSISVSVRQEFDLLNDYFTIQKYRYGGAITMEYEIEDERLLENEIPRFSLQPIVENAIFHGIEPKGQAGTIRIRLFSPEEGVVQVDVTDNGVGIPKEKIQELLLDGAPDSGSFFRNVGVSNVHKRLQYTYGEYYGLRIESELGSYTKVSTRIPRKEIKMEQGKDEGER